MTATHLPLPASPVSAAGHGHADHVADPGEPADPLRRLEAELLAMPPVAALGLRIADADGDRLCLHAPLASNVNDKGCAFGGSLASLMTLAGWSLLTLRLMRAGVDADVYVADSELKYRAPLFEDLRAEARPAADAGATTEGSALDACVRAVAQHGRGELRIDAEVRCADGTLACRSRSRFVAKRRG